MFLVFNNRRVGEKRYFYLFVAIKTISVTKRTKNSVFIPIVHRITCSQNIYPMSPDSGNFCEFTSQGKNALKIDGKM